jgi:hypothetical protein
MKKFKMEFTVELTIIGALTTLLFVGVSLPEVFPRAVHRLLHTTGAIIFLGNIVVSALWFSVAAASRKNEWFAFASLNQLHRLAQRALPKTNCWLSGQALPF